MQAIDELLEKIFAPTERDSQTLIGPSGLGNPCDVCLALELAVTLGHEQPDPGANLPTWIGTAMHSYIEMRLAQETNLLLEHRVTVGEIAGYGTIKGTADVYHRDVQLIVDWKGSSKAKIRGYKFGGIPTNHEYQRALYGLGARNAGLEVELVANVYIPRDGFRLSEVWYDVKPYDEGLAHAALQRAETIWTEYVLPNRIDLLGSDDDCFACNSFTGEVVLNGNRRV